MATKAELEVELKQTRKDLTVLKGEIKALKEKASNSYIETLELKASGKQKDKGIAEQEEVITRQNASIVTLQKQLSGRSGEISELRLNLEKSWDKKTATEVIDLFMDGRDLSAP